jgi:hypothetical protein
VSAWNGVPQRARGMSDPNHDAYRHPAWKRADLARWGWAPGQYEGGSCRKCGIKLLPSHAKRAWQCAPCAADAEWRAAQIDAALNAEYLPNKEPEA